MSKYLKYTIINTAPIRIADDETSQHGQTDTLRYFPGSTIRGYVITNLSHEKDFKFYKKELFSGKICFLNAYPCIEKQELIPSPKNFYEDKSEVAGRKELKNVMTEDVAGYKRASLGRFCYIENDCVHYTDVEVGEDVSINTGKEAAKRNVFRSQYIKKNQTFSGYIVFHDGIADELIEKIVHTFNQPMFLGNRKSAGYGACNCIQKPLPEGLPYQKIRSEQGGADLYMMLLSDTVMRDKNGELTGLCLEELEARLGCESLEIEKCATSVTDIRGYNRMWQGMIPSAVMYAAGSVFHLKLSAPVTEEKLRQLEASGIGIRRDEGFGQIAFIRDYAKIRYKQPLEKVQRERAAKTSWGKKCDTDEDIRIAATGFVMRKLESAMERYIVEQKLELSGISESKKGLLRSMCMELHYQPEEAKQQIVEYIEHDRQKDEKRKKHDGKQKQTALYQYVHKVFDTDLYALLGLKWENHQVMGMDIREILTEAEIIQYKLKLMIGQLRYENRGGKA